MTATVVDPGGQDGTAEVSVEVLAENTAPTCTIEAPDDGGAAAQGTTVALRGVADDAEVGPEGLTATWDSDLDGVLDTETPSSEGTVLYATDTLTPGTHQLTLTVEDEAGAVCTDTILYSVGTPPSLTVVTPEVGDVYALGAPIPFEAEVADPDEPAGALTLSWTSSLDGFLSAEGADASGLVGFSLDDLSAGDHSLEVRVTDSDGLYTQRVRTFRVNTPPQIASADVAPDAAAVGETLVCAALASDADGATPTVTYAWSNGATGAAYVVQPSDEPGTVLTCTATATDDDGATVQATAEGTVLNTDPVVSADVTPTAARVGETLTCAAVASDADGDVPAVAFTWSDGSTGASRTLTAADDPGTALTCTATATDPDGGLATGQASATVLNTDPVLGPVSVTPPSGRVGDTVVCEASASDADGAAPAVTCTWSDGTSGASRLLTAADDPGDVLQCTATADDGDGGTASGTASATVLNTDPVLGPVGITPHQPHPRRHPHLRRGRHRR